MVVLRSLYAFPVYLQSNYVGGSRPARAVLDAVLNTLAFSQGFETVGGDCGEVYEYIFAAVVLLNETKTFAFVEPLHLTRFLRHYFYLLNILQNLP